MTAWISAVPALLTAVLALTVPGLAILAAARVRGVLLVALAPALSAATVALAALAGGLLGVRWSPLVVLAATVVVAGGAAVVRALVRAPVPGSRALRASPRRAVTLLTTAVLAVVALVVIGLQARRLLGAIGDPDTVSQSYDSVYHYNAVAFITDGGDASPLAMTMGTPDRATSFYPTLVHAVAALVVDVAGVGSVEAVNVVAVAVVLLVWPASLLALTRVALGPNPLLLASTLGLAFAFPQFPNRMLSFGVLYPNLLSYAMLPAALALAVLVLRSRGRRRIVPALLAALTVAGLLVAHPNGLIAFLALAAPIVLVALVQLTVRGARHGWPTVALAWAGALAGAALLAVLFTRVPLLANMRGAEIWAVQGSVRESLLGVLDLSTPSIHLVGQPSGTGEPLIVVAVLVIAGVVVAARTRAWRWLPVSYAVAAGLWVVAASWDHPLRAVLTGYWYTDAIRLAALLPVLGVPLAALGVLGLARLVRLTGPRAFRWATGRRAAAGARHAAGAGRRPAALAGGVIVVAALLAGALVAGRLPAAKESFALVQWIHTEPLLLDPAELDFLDEVGDIVPADAAVVTNPWDGGALVWAIEGIPAVNPNIRATLDEPRRILAEGLVNAGTDPRVCDAVEELDAWYVLQMTGVLSSEDPPWAPHLGFPGIYGLEDAGVARVVADDGYNRLLEITACSGGP